MDRRAALPGEMDHALIEADQIPDRYLMGKLAAEESARFEEHFLDCPRCLEHLETVEGLRRTLKQLPAGEVAPGRASEGSAPFARRLAFRARPFVPLLAAACLVLAAVPSAFFLAQLRRTRGELESALKTSEEARSESAGLARALESARVGARNATPLAASVFTLNLTRGAGTGPPDNRIVLSDSPEWVVLLFDRPDSPGFESYRARISTAEGRPVGDALTASAASSGMLAVSLHSSLLARGDYVLTLEGLGTGSARDLATYRFRAALRK